MERRGGAVNMQHTSWVLRRRFMWVVSCFCMGVIAYVLGSGLDTAPADTAMTMAFLTLLGIVGSYVFGATWDDHNLMKFGGKNGNPQ